MSDDRVKPLPLDANRNPVSGLFVPIVSGGVVTKYLPALATDNGDGTATLALTTVVNPNIDIGNVNLMNILDQEIDPATEQQQIAIIAAINAISAGGVDPVGLKNIGGTPIDPATEATLALMKTALDQFKFIGDSLDVKESFVQALAEDPSTAIGTRLKNYEQISNLVSSPITFNVKADMDTLYSATDSNVRVLLITKPSKDINLTVTNADGTSDSILIERNEIFNLSTFDIVSFEITLTGDATALRILAEGFGG